MFLSPIRVRVRIRVKVRFECPFLLEESLDKARESHDDKIEDEEREEEEESEADRPAKGRDSGLPDWPITKGGGILAACTFKSLEIRVMSMDLWPKSILS